MTTSPTDIARLAHRQGLMIHYPGAGFDFGVAGATPGVGIWVDRLQSINPSIALNTETYFEIGSFDPVGAGFEPPEGTLDFQQNISGYSAGQGSDDVELIMAGKNPKTYTTGAYNMSDYINASGSLIAWVMYRANGASVASSELMLDRAALEELTWSFQVGRPSTFGAKLRAPIAKFYTSGLHTTVWGAGSTKSTNSAGAIRGRDARIYFGGSAAANVGYRVQSATIRAAFPMQDVMQLGDRNRVGYLSDVPEITCDFEVLAADHQPIDQFFTGTPYDSASPATLGEMWLKIYDPAAAAAFSGDTGTVLRWLKLENVVAASADIGTGQVRGMLTHRYSVRVSKSTTASSGGLIVYRN